MRRGPIRLRSGIPEPGRRCLAHPRPQCRAARRLRGLGQAGQPHGLAGEPHPGAVSRRLSVIHDGIDTDLLRPDSGARITLGRDGLSLGAGDEVVTFVNRNLEPYRGYHSFMRALPEILRRRPKARAVIVGGSDTSYGAKPPAGRTWREIFLDEVRADLDLSGSISSAGSRIATMSTCCGSRRSTST